MAPLLAMFGDFFGIFDTFGVSLDKLLIQLAIWLIPAFFAHRHVVARRTGASLLGWLFLIWFLPVIGPTLALVLVRKPALDQA